MKYYTHGCILTMNPELPVIPDGFICVEGTQIHSVGSMSELPGTPDSSQAEDMGGKILMPGMVCTHSHFYGQLIRGMAVQFTLRNWQQVLSRLWWNVDRCLDEEMTYASALMGLKEGLLCGVTSFVDHHASPSFCTGSLDILEQAVKQAGARAILSYEVSDRNGAASCKEGLLENVRFIEKCRGRDDKDTVRAMFGLHALYSLSTDTLHAAAEAEKPYNVGFHIHCAEDRADVVDAYRNYDMHTVEELLVCGIIREKTILAHFVHTQKPEWEIVRKAGASIAHNPQSNASNAVGICPVSDMLNDGVHVALGGDGFYYDLFQELNLAMLLQKLKTGDPRAMGSEQLQELAFTNPYRVISNAFGKSFGILKAGYQADFIAVDYDAPTPIHKNNYMSHLVSAFTGHVTDSVIAGRRIVQARTVLGLSPDTAEFCRRQAARLETAFRTL